MIRVGIAGMGGMGWFHASRYFQIPGVQITAVADVRPERLEAKNAVAINIENRVIKPDLSSVQRFAGAAEMIEQADVDVIDICLPSFLHPKYAIQALAAGRHVLCEKPMALTVADANAMIAAARQARRKLMIAQCIRFWPEYQYLQQVIERGSLGQLLSLHLYRIGGRPSGWGWENWFMDPARSGGALFDLHVHDVDFVNSLLGAPDRVQASIRSTTPGSACQIIHALYEYAGGPQVSIHAGWNEVPIPFRAGYEAWFERGFLRLDPTQTPELVEYDNETAPEGRPAVYQPGDAYYNEIEYFLHCVEHDQEPVACLPESARDSLVLLGREQAVMVPEGKA